MEQLNERRRAPEALMVDGPCTLSERALHRFNHLTELVIWQRCLYEKELEVVLSSAGLRKLTLRGVNAENHLAQEPTHARQAIHSKSRIQALDFNYPPEIRINFPQRLASLVLISSLETLLTTPKSFKGIGQFLATITLPLPGIRHLSISSDGCPGSLNKLHLLSFLHRCPTLETLQISYPILSKALTNEDHPANLPNLETYEGRQDYVPYFHAPSLRRALVKHFPWDGGALIDALASMSTDLESLVIESTSKLDDPVMNDIKASFPMGRDCCRKVESFLGLQTKVFPYPSDSPLGEWIHSARVGRTDGGELFIEYFSRREEAMGYLSDMVTVKAAL
ncbi:hypothetical protein FS837_003019 [Tulasnella sp. UAMH 9824]|nr:hypothetical protein FS837_003019 [Tulasnella sp. UAMH 9824]